jgi:uncharacterized protein (UPF0261 family)
MSIAIVGMLDEREEALRLIKEVIERRGHKTCLIDISIGTGAIVPTVKPDVSCAELAQLTGSSDGATTIMTEGLRAKISALFESGELQGIIAITGMTGALITLPAMKVLPFGIPKLLISSATALPVHAGQFANYFALRDITVMHAVVDTVGMNPLVQNLAINGANAISGMIEGRNFSPGKKKPAVAISEFGFCDKGAHYIRELLNKDYEIVSFHATGVGDKAIIDLVGQGVFDAFIDLVPGAFSEHLLGGNRGIAGPNRLEVAAALSIPYIFCPGGFDMISCGPSDRRDKNDPLWTARKLTERKLYLQDPFRVQARMIPSEAGYVGMAAAEKLNSYPGKARVKVVLPLRGFSSISVAEGPLYDPEADKSFMTALKGGLDPSIDLVEVDSDINSPKFAEAVVNALLQAFRANAR